MRPLLDSSIVAHRFDATATRQRMAALLAFVMAIAGCARETTPPLDVAAWKAATDSFRQDRIDSLTSDDGWVTLVGLFWLEPGVHRVGSDRASDIRLPGTRATKAVGKLTVAGDTVRFDADPSAHVTLAGEPVTSVQLRPLPDSARPLTLAMGTLRATLIKRTRGLALRVRDTANPNRAAFPGLAHFDPDTSWRLPARFEPYDPPRKVRILDVTGSEDEKSSPGAIVFTKEQEEFRVDVLTDDDTTTYWMIFKDGTSGAETYGAGRYLHAPRPDASGHLTLDFNRAYNPPCAYTRFATCPLPPPQNKLALRVTAGEKRYPGEKALYQESRRQTADGRR
jgi:uncharacterized protein